MALQNLLKEINEKIATFDKEIASLEKIELDSGRAADLHDVGIKIQAIKTRLYEIDIILLALTIV